MKLIQVGSQGLEVPKIGPGCMRIPGLGSKKAVRELIDTAMEQGINFFLAAGEKLP